MKKGVLFKTVRVMLVLAASMAIAGTLWILRPQAERQEMTDNGRLVEVFAVQPQSLAMTVEAFGTVEPREALNLVAEVRGQIVSLGPSFFEGAAVRKGDLIVAVDPRTYELEVRAGAVQVRQVEAELKRLEQEIRNLKVSRGIAASEVALAKAEFDRLQTLSNRKVVAQTNRDQAEQQYLANLERLQTIDNQLALTEPNRARLLAEKDMAEVRRQQALLDLERTRIEAPFDGWVLEKAVEAGQHTAIGQYLGRIYRAGALDIEVNIPTRELAWLPAEITAGEMPQVVVGAADDADGRTWSGRVARVMARMEAKTRTLPVVVEVDDPMPSGAAAGGASQLQARLRPGTFVRVTIDGRRFDGLYVLPRHVLHDDETVYLAVDGRLKIQPVRVLRRYGENVFVDRGLSQGDLLITTPLAEATDGMKLRIR